MNINNKKIIKLIDIRNISNKYKLNNNTNNTIVNKYKNFFKLNIFNNNNINNNNNDNNKSKQLHLSYKLIKYNCIYFSMENKIDNNNKDKIESNKKSNNSKLNSNNKSNVKVVKGARDFLPYQMSLRNKVFKIITEIFKKHGAVEIDTPIFELRETLMGKYGEESKLIYELMDQGGELIALRYDLTVPFARYMATTYKAQKSIKRYHIGKVYRRDDPIMTKGRFREFYQCDLDIVGSNYGKMVPDAEILKVAVEILSEIKVGKFIIKINHRKLLDLVINIAGISNDKFKTVCSSIDKLDKEEWKTVKKELLNKGVDDEKCEKLWTYCQLKDSPWKLFDLLSNNLELMNSETENKIKGKEVLQEMKTLFEYLDAYNITQFISFDLSLARGLDYYTGLIYEGILTEGVSVGSICGGGRYDDLIGMFSSEAKPAVGISIGIERIFSILEKVYKDDLSLRECETEVFVVSVGKTNLTLERMKILNELWDAGIKAEMLYNEVPRLDKQNDYINKQKIPLAIFIGEDEIKNNKIKLKNLNEKTEVNIDRQDMIEKIKDILKLKNF